MVLVPLRHLRTLFLEGPQGLVLLPLESFLQPCLYIVFAQVKIQVTENKSQELRAFELFEKSG